MSIEIIVIPELSMQFFAYLLAVHSASSFVSGLGVHIDIELPPKPYIQRGEAHTPALHQANPERHLASSETDDFVIEFGHGKHRGDLSVRAWLKLVGRPADSCRMMAHISSGRTFHILLL